jgi:hypothetical protein
MGADLDGTELSQLAAPATGYTTSGALTGGVTFPIPGTSHTAGMTILGSVDSTGKVLAGVRSNSDLSLKTLLPSVQLPKVDGQDVDFTLAEADGSSAFGLLFSTQRIEGSINDQPVALRSFFRPLFGRPESDQSAFPLVIPSGGSVLGSFELPEFLAGYVEKIGLQSRVNASGTLPVLKPTDPLSLSLGMSVQSDLLPDYLDSAALSIGVTGGINQPLSFTLGGRMGLRFPSGMPADAAAALGAAGIPVRADEPVAADAECPSGDPVLVDEDPAEYRCFDTLDVTGSGSLVVSTTGDVTTKFAAGLTTPEGTWRPFGLEWLSVNRLRFELELGVSVGVPTVGIGAQAEIVLLDDKDLVFAFDMNATGVPPAVAFELDGIWVASGDGLALSDLFELQHEIAKVNARINGADPPPAFDVDDLEIPDVAVRNAQFSFAPAAIPSLCIKAGFLLTGDLYINPTEEAPKVAPSCQNNTLSIPDPDDQCIERREDGCVSSIALQVSSDGILGLGQIPAFDLGPLQLDDLNVDLALTVGDQHLTIAAGAALDDPFGGSGTVAEGRVGIKLKAAEMDVHGYLDMFGFNTVVDITGGLNLLTDPDPAFDMHVRLMADFSDAASVLLDPPLRAFKAGATAVDAVWSALQSGDPLTAVPALERLLESYDIEVPEELRQVTTTISKISEGIATFGGFDFGLDLVLGGVQFADFPGIELGYTPETCLGIQRGGGCWLVPPGCVDFGPFGEACSDGEEAVVVPRHCAGSEQDGVCYVLGAWPRAGFGVPGLCDLLLDDDEPCSLDQILSPLLMDAFTAITGLDVPEGTTIGSLIDDLGDLGDATEPQLRIECAAFDLALGGATSDGSAAEVGVDLALDLFGIDVDLGVDWDFTISPDDFDDIAAGDLDDLGATLRAVQATLDALLDIHESDCTPVSEEDQEAAEDVLDAVDVDLTASPAVVAEGSTVTLAGTVTGSEEQVTIDWGDGSPATTVSPGGIGQISATHVYVDDGAPDSPAATYTIAALVESTTARTRVTVTNVAPTTTPQLEVEAVDEGSTVRITGDLVDPGTADRLLVEVDWGDGQRTVSRPPLELRDFLHSHRYADDDPTGTPQDTYTITVKVSDHDTGTSTATTTLLVRDVAPTVSLEPVQLNGLEASGTVIANEGSTVTYEGTVTDPGTDRFVAKLTWGDGTTTSVPLAAGTQTFRLSHTFRDDAPSGTPFDDYVVTAEVADDDGRTGTATYTQRVANTPPKPPTLQASAPRASEGGEYGLAVEFGDTGALDTHTVRIDWGDGTPATVQTLALGERRTAAFHVYVDDDPTGTPSDTYTATITVTDDDMGERSVTRDVIVDNVDPDVIYSVAPTDPDEGDQTPVVVGGLVADRGLRDTHVITVDWGAGWGDARFEQVPVAPDTRLFRAERRFGDDGVFDVVVTVTDDDTGSSSTPATPVTVENVAPELRIDRAPTEHLPAGDVWMTRVGVPVVVDTTTTDPGSDDLRSTWAWGDGSPTERIDDLANPPATDPDPSPAVQPRSVSASRSHAYAHPCVRTARLGADDDDDGTVSHTADVAVVDDWSHLHTTVFWELEHRLYDRTLLGIALGVVPDADLDCYLGTVRRLSSVFGEVRDLGRPADAARTLSVVSSAVDLLRPPIVRERERLDRDLLAAWLNVASGATGTTADGRLIPAFRDAITAAEAVRLDPTANPQDMRRATNALDKAVFDYSCRGSGIVSDLLRPFREC